jgi:hypothetical protein
VSEEPPRPPGEGQAEDPELQHRLDPELAAGLAGAPAPTPPAVIDTRPYRWAIGVLGLVLVVALSVYTFASRGVGSAGIKTGQRLHFFSAPLATSNLVGDANMRPPCDPARHDPRALNICLLAARGPLVLAFFVPASDDCRREIDTLQTVSKGFPPGTVQFAAVAIRVGHAEAAKLVRSHGWTFPIAYDRDGAIGSTYGAVICPLVELAYRGGIVKDRLIGNHWLATDALARRVRALLQ